MAGLTGVLDTIAPVAGIGGIAIALVIWLFRSIIARKIFPRLTRDQSYKIIRLIVLCSFVLGLTGVAAWSLIELQPNVPNERAQQLDDKTYTTRPIDGLPGLKVTYPGDWKLGVGIPLEEPVAGDWDERRYFKGIMVEIVHEDWRSEAFERMRAEETVEEMVDRVAGDSGGENAEVDEPGGIWNHQSRLRRLTDSYENIEVIEFTIDEDTQGRSISPRRYFGYQYKFDDPASSAYWEYLRVYSDSYVDQEDTTIDHYAAYELICQIPRDELESLEGACGQILTSIQLFGSPSEISHNSAD